jgi:CRISPR-associated endonuclease Cas3-HD
MAKKRNELIAKFNHVSGRPTETLIEHSMATARLAVWILDNWLLSKNAKRYMKIEDVREAVAIAAALHDVGKACDDFQKKVYKEKPVEDSLMNAQPIDAEWKNSKSIGRPYFRHNVVSWAFVSRYVQCKLEEQVLSAILYHHVIYPKDTAGKSNSTLTSSDVIWNMNAGAEEKERIVNTIKTLCEMCNTEFGTSARIYPNGYSNPCKNSQEIDDVRLTQKIDNPSAMSMYIHSSEYLIIRTSVIYADRMLAMYPGLTESINSGDYSIVKNLLDKMDVLEHAEELKGFDITKLKDATGRPAYDLVRLKSQLETLDKMEEFFSQGNGIFNLSASAGWGKTLFGLNHIIRSGKKALWIQPINQIADGTYRSIISEIEHMGLQEKLSVGLFVTGEFVYGNEDSDIIVMIVDSFLSPLYKNTNAHLFIRRLGCTVIFDEYHELFCREPLFPGFVKTLFARNSSTNSQTLLMSATPKKLPVFEKGRYMECRPEPFNGDMKIRIHYMKIENLNQIDVKENDAFVILPKVEMVQQMYSILKKRNKTSGILHARYSKDDKLKKREQMYQSHDKHSLQCIRNVTVGTHIISTGNDISASAIYEVCLTPDKSIQAVFGRCGRFREEFYNGVGDYYVIDINDGGITRLRNEMYDAKLTAKWIDVLKSYDGRTITKNELYELWEEFHKDNKEELNKLYNQFMRDGDIIMSNMRPYATRRRNDDTDEKILPSNDGWRGANNTIYTVARNKQDIQIEYDSESLNYVKEEWDDKNARRARIALFNKNIPNFKHIFNIDNPPTKEAMFRLAKSNASPMLLYHHIYDSDFGLLTPRNAHLAK